MDTDLGSYEYALYEDVTGYMGSHLSEYLKKDPNSAYLRIVQAHVKLLRGDQAAAVKFADEAIALKPTDRKTLHLLAQLLIILGKYDLSVKVYDDACRRTPTIAQAYTWFERACHKFDYVAMQKSSFLLPKPNAVNLRLFKLWSAQCMIMALETQRMKGNRIVPMLGLKTLEPLKPFTTSQEMYVYAKLLMIAGRVEDATEEIVKFLHEKDDDLELRCILLDALEERAMWTKLFEVCKHNIVDIRVDDWAVWTALAKAASHLDKLTDVERLLNETNSSRNRDLAYIYVDKLRREIQAEHVCSYITKYGHKTSCFPDLKIFIEDFAQGMLMREWEKVASAKKIDEVMKGARKATTSDLIFIVNMQKFKLLTQPEILTTHEFISECAGLYSATNHLLNSKEKTDYFAGDEFLLMAVQGILSQNTHDLRIKDILGCILILENAATRDTHEFHVRLWLVKLYQLINCFDLALGHFNSLSIKEMQWDTLTHYVQTRLDTLSTTEQAMAELQKVEDLYELTKTPIERSIVMAFKSGSFNKIRGFVDLGNRLNRSLTKYLNLLSTHRYGILRGEEPKHYFLPELKEMYMSVLNDQNYTSLELDLDCRISDNRDLKTMWQFGTEDIDPMLNEKLSIGPEQDVRYLKVMAAKELVYGGDARALNFQLFLEATLEDDEHTSRLTEMELWSLQVQVELSKFVLRETNDISPITALLTKRPQPPASTLSWKTNHYFLILMDLCKNLNAYMKVHHTSTTKKSFAKLQKEVVKITDYLREAALDFKAKNATTVAAFEQEMLDWTAKDGKVFEISANIVKSVFGQIKESSDASLASLRKF